MFSMVVLGAGDLRENPPSDENIHLVRCDTWFGAHARQDQRPTTTIIGVGKR